MLKCYGLYSKALKLSVEDPEIYRSKAEELSMKFGDKFEEGYKAKLNEIQRKLIREVVTEITTPLQRDFNVDFNVDFVLFTKVLANFNF